MMLVSSLMVHPGARITEDFSFPFIWASGALIIFNTWYKLRWGQLGKIVKKPLKKYSRLTTVANHLSSVLSYGM